MDFKIYMYTDQTIHHHHLDIVLIDKVESTWGKNHGYSCAVGCQYWEQEQVQREGWSL